jgi:hypothetical protein
VQRMILEWRSEVRQRRRLSAWLALGLAAASCSKVSVLVSGDDDASTTTTATASTTTTATGSTTSSTSSTACPADLTAALGASAACNACVGQSCCPEAQEFVATHSFSAYEALVACAVGVDSNGPCAAACVSTVCASAYALALYQACAQCLTASCCASFDACQADAQCSACIWVSPEGCCSDELYHAWQDCYGGSCMSACGPGNCASAP